MGRARCARSSSTTSRWRGRCCASTWPACRRVEVIAECANGFEAVKAVAEQAPDLVLLDVQMPKLDGFEVVELIGRATPVIFVTAYDEFAVRAFEVHAVDYLLKPVSAERLAEAIARVPPAGAGAAGDAAGRRRCGRRSASADPPSGSWSATGRRSTSSTSTPSTTCRRATTTWASIRPGRST